MTKTTTTTITTTTTTTTTTKDVLIQYLFGPMTKTTTKTTANLRDALNHSYLVPWGT